MYFTISTTPKSAGIVTRTVAPQTTTVRHHRARVVIAPDDLSFGLYLSSDEARELVNKLGVSILEAERADLDFALNESETTIGQGQVRRLGASTETPGSTP